LWSFWAKEEKMISMEDEEEEEEKEKKMFSVECWSLYRL
jgi:endogenous inhibitor of DNA gyrase (YacG/DUF329 family)